MCFKQHMLRQSPTSSLSSDLSIISFSGSNMFKSCLHGLLVPDDFSCPEVRIISWFQVCYLVIFSSFQSPNFLSVYDYTLCTSSSSATAQGIQGSMEDVNLWKLQHRIRRILITILRRLDLDDAVTFQRVEVRQVGFNGFRLFFGRYPPSTKKNMNGSSQGEMSWAECIMCPFFVRKIQDFGKTSRVSLFWHIFSLKMAPRTVETDIE